MVRLGAKIFSGIFVWFGLFVCLLVSQGWIYKQDAAGVLVPSEGGGNSGSAGDSVPKAWQVGLGLALGPPPPHPTPWPAQRHVSKWS